MNGHPEILSPGRLLDKFLDNVGDDFTYVIGLNPFVIRFNGSEIYVYIKNLSPAQLSNNNPDIWRIQLPIREDFEKIKSSDSLFLLLGYDHLRKVFTTWNPYWCKQRLNVGKSVSLYSRLSLQQRVEKTHVIEKMSLNNDGDVVCIPIRMIGDYIKNIRQFYPEETEFVAKGSRIQKRLKEMDNADKVFGYFKEQSKDLESFRFYMIEHDVSNSSSLAYKRYVNRIFDKGLIDKYKDVFLKADTLSQYNDVLEDFFRIDEVDRLNTESHRYYHAALNHYLKYLLWLSVPKSVEIEKPLYENTSGEFNDEQEKIVQGYELNEFGQLISLEEPMRRQLYEYVKDEEYPDYETMIEVACKHYPASVTDKMSVVEWMKLFTSKNFLKGTGGNRNNLFGGNHAKPSVGGKLKVTLPEGRVICYEHAVDTYVEVISLSFPDLISEMGIYHAGVNIVSKQYDQKYKSYQRIIDGGYLVMTNSSTLMKYRDLCQINSELELDMKIELLDVETDGKEMFKESKDKDSSRTMGVRQKTTGRFKIRVEFPDGRIIQPSKVLDALLEVVIYAGPERVKNLNIFVCGSNLIATSPVDGYEIACKPVPGGFYVNTCSDTKAKMSQIREISNALNLHLKLHFIDPTKSSDLFHPTARIAGLMSNLPRERQKRKKIRIEYPDGRCTAHSHVFETLIEVVNYAGPQKVRELNLMLCGDRLILSQPLPKYEKACKKLEQGLYINTASDTETKYKQIQLISKKLNLGLKVKLI